MEYKKGKWPYFDHERMLSPYWQDPYYQMFVVIGTKNTGKTTSFLKWAIDNAKANCYHGQKRFALILRRQREVQTYWDSFTNKGDWWRGCRLAKDYVIEWLAVDGVWYPIGRIMSLGGSGAGRSKQHGGYSCLIIDDVVPLPNESLMANISNKLIILANNLGRANFNEMRILVTANNNRQDSEFFNEFDIQPSDGGGIQVDKKLKTIVYTEGYRTKHGWIAQQHKDLEGVMKCFPDAQKYLTRNEPLVKSNDYINQQRVTNYEVIWTIVVNARPFEYGSFYDRSDQLKQHQLYLLTPVRGDIDDYHPVIALDDVSINSVVGARMPKNIAKYCEKMWKIANAGLLRFFYLGHKKEIITALTRHTLKIDRLGG